MVAVQLDGRALQFASEELIDDVDVVQTAINENYYALRYASERLRKELEPEEEKEV